MSTPTPGPSTSLGGHTEASRQLETDQEYRARIWARIGELEGEVRKLKSCHNATTPVCRLPIEILSAVFAAASQISLSVLVRATHTCRHWRIVALDCPDLWKELCSSVFLSDGLGDDMLDRSKQLPLTVSYVGDRDARPSGPPVDVASLSRALFDLERLRSVEVSNAYDVDIILPTLLSEWPAFHAPILETLRLVNIVDPDDYYLMGTPEPDYEELQASYFGFRSLLGSAPLLRDLTLSHLEVGWGMLPLGPNLTRLRLLEDLRYDRACAPSTRDFVQSLKQMPHLESLELHGFLPPADSVYTVRHAAFTFPPELKSLKLSDASDRLAHFFQFARVLDMVPITVTFFQEEFDKEDFQDVLKYLKPSVGVGRASATVEKFVDQCSSTSFRLHFSGREQGTTSNAEGSDGYFGSITLECGRGPTPRLEPKDYYAAIFDYFDVQTLRCLELCTTPTTEFDDETWSYFQHIPSLQSIKFSHSFLYPFILHLKRDPALSEARRTGNEQSCWFSALTTLECASVFYPHLSSAHHLAHVVDVSRPDITLVFKERKAIGVDPPRLSFSHLDKLSEKDIRHIQEVFPELNILASTLAP